MPEHDHLVVGRRDDPWVHPSLLLGWLQRIPELVPGRSEPIMLTAEPDRAAIRKRRRPGELHLRVVETRQLAIIAALDGVERLHHDVDAFLSAQVACSLGFVICNPILPN